MALNLEDLQHGIQAFFLQTLLLLLLSSFAHLALYLCRANGSSLSTLCPGLWARLSSMLPYLLLG